MYYIHTGTRANSGGGNMLQDRGASQGSRVRGAHHPGVPLRRGQSMGGYEGEPRSNSFDSQRHSVLDQGVYLNPKP
jgi:hypothetical protein